MATNKTTNKATKKKAEEVKTEEVVEMTPEAAGTPVCEKPTKFDDTLRVIVQSNVHGGLLFINQRTGDKTEWNQFGDKQTLTMGDLRSMRGAQRAFFENNWIFVECIDEEGYEDVTPEDVYKALMVTQYYKNSLTPDNFYDLFSMSPDELRKRIHRMSADAKTNLIVAANDGIRNGSLDSLRVIQAIEETLGCELVKIS